jgi:phosphoribosylanthranilate isomerase
MATKVKICGITRAEDARQAVELGAWAIGLILKADSPRLCDIATAEAIGAELRRETEVTGVFVNATLDEVAEAVDRCSLGIVQLHGDEGPAYCAEVARRTGAKVMKVARIRDKASVRALYAYNVDFRMVDSWSPERQGGTGQPFDWSLIGRQGRVPLVLSGGLNPDNVGAAIASVHPFAVDTASGTEASPGIKDPALVTAFFRAVAQADPPVPADEEPAAPSEEEPAAPAAETPA